MRLSVLLVTYNCTDFAARAIECVFSCTRSCEFEIIVIDNASTDGTPDALQSTYPTLQVIKNGTNVGFARACNQAITLARGEYLVLLNTDCFLQNDSFGEMLSYLDVCPDVGIVGAKLLNVDTSLQGSCRRFVTMLGEVFATLPYLNKIPLQWFHRDVLEAAHAHVPILVDYVSGACFMFRRTTCNVIGGFDEELFMYSEEEDFCLRARRAGIRTAYVPSAVAVHVGGASFGTNVRRRSRL